MKTDGKTRVATIDDIVVGVVLRSVDRNGFSYPFSDMVVARCYLFQDQMAFDCKRPHPGGVEDLQMLSAGVLSHGGYHVVLLASGKVATHHFTYTEEVMVNECGAV